MSILDRFKRKEELNDEISDAELEQIAREISEPITEATAFRVPESTRLYRKGEAAVGRVVDPITGEIKEDISRVAKKQNLAAAAKKGGRALLGGAGLVTRSLIEGFTYDPSKGEQRKVSFRPENLIEDDTPFDFSAPAKEQTLEEAVDMPKDATEKMHKEADFLEAKARKYNNEGKIHELNDMTTTHLEGALTFDELAETEHQQYDMDFEAEKIMSEIQSDLAQKMKEAEDPNYEGEYHDGALGEEEKRIDAIMKGIESDTEDVLSGTGFNDERSLEEVVSSKNVDSVDDLLADEGLEGLEDSEIEKADLDGKDRLSIVNFNIDVDDPKDLKKIQASLPSLDQSKPVKVSNYRRKSTTGSAVPVRRHSRRKVKN